MSQMMPHPSGPALPEAIQALHTAIAQHPDPQSKQILTGCLQNMLKVQSQDMQQQQQGPEQPGPPPQQMGQGMGGAPPQLQALLGALGR